MCYVDIVEDRFGVHNPEVSSAAVECAGVLQGTIKYGPKGHIDDHS